MRDPGLTPSLLKFISKYWDEALRKNAPNPEMYVARQAAHDYAERAIMEGTMTRDGAIPVSKSGYGGLTIIPKESV